MANIGRCMKGLDNKDQAAIRQILQDESNGGKITTEMKYRAVNDHLDNLYEERLALAKQVHKKGGYIPPIGKTVKQIKKEEHIETVQKSGGFGDSKVQYNVADSDTDSNTRIPKNPSNRVMKAHGDMKTNPNGQHIYEALESMLGYMSPASKFIAKKLLPIISEMEVQVYSESNADKLGLLPEMELNWRGVYVHASSSRGKDARIIIRDRLFEDTKGSGVLARVFLHEVLHAIVAPSKGDIFPTNINYKQFRDEMESIMKYVVQETGATKDEHYGLTNVDEFISELVANSTFQDFLQSVPIKDYQGNKQKLNTSVFTLIADKIMKLLGIPRKYKTALTEALLVFDDIYDRAEDINYGDAVDLRGSNGTLNFRSLMLMSDTEFDSLTIENISDIGPFMYARAKAHRTFGTRPDSKATIKDKAYYDKHINAMVKEGKAAAKAEGKPYTEWIDEGTSDVLSKFGIEVSIHRSETTNPDGSTVSEWFADMGFAEETIPLSGKDNDTTRPTRSQLIHALKTAYTKEKAELLKDWRGDEGNLLSDDYTSEHYSRRIGEGRKTTPSHLSAEIEKENLANIKENTLESMEKMAKRMLKKLDVNVRLLNFDQAKAFTKAKYGIDSTEYKDLVTGNTSGFSITNASDRASADTQADTFGIYIDRRKHPLIAYAALAHEIGHVIKAQFFDKATDREKEAITQEFKRWEAKYNKGGVRLEDLLHSKKDHSSVLDILAALDESRENYLGELSAEEQAYVTSMEEWFADQAGKALSRRARRPRGVIKRFFHDLVTEMSSVFGVDQTEMYIRKLAGETDIIPEAVRQKMENVVRMITRDKTVKSAQRFLAKHFSDKDHQLRRVKNLWVSKLADTMYKSRGDTRSDKSYVMMRQLALGRFESKLNKIMAKIQDDKGEISKEEQARITDILYSAEDSNDPVVNELRALMEELANYMEDAGVHVPARRKNYFAQVVDVDALQTHEEEFIKMMERYPVHMEGLFVEWGLDMREDSTLTVEDVPHILYDHLIGNQGIDEDEGDGIQMPGMRNLNKRLITFLKGDDLKTWNDDFLTRNPMDAATAYIFSAVKKAESHRLWGRALTETQQSRMRKLVEKRLVRQGYDAEDNLDELDQPISVKASAEAIVSNYSRLDYYIEKARESGASEAELKLMQDTVYAELGTYGRETAQWLHDKLGIPMPDGGAPINKTLMASMSTMMVAANVMLLGLSMLTSIADPLGIAVRTGDTKAFTNAFGKGIKDVYKMTKSGGTDKSYAIDVGEQLGIISDASIRDALRNGYANVYMSSWVKKTSDMFFRLNGLEGWTKITRVMAVEAAMQSLKQDKLDSKLYKELGLKEGDVKLDDDKEIIILNDENYDTYLKGKTKSERIAYVKANDRVKTAISEFVAQSILRPTPSQRPLAGSDPHFALIMHLKSFMYAFHKTILAPSVRELTMHDNAKPLIGLAMYAPVMVGVGMAKDVIKFGTIDTPYKSEWGPLDYLIDGAEKGGLGGLLQPIFDAGRDMEYGGTGIGAFVSPVLTPWDTFTHAPLPFNYWLK